MEERHVPVYEAGRVTRVPPEPDDQAGHPKLLFELAHYGEHEPRIEFVACATCLGELIEEALSS